MNVQLVLAILSLAVRYGIPAVQKVVEEWSKDHEEITLEDIEKLKELVKHPDEYK